MRGSEYISTLRGSSRAASDHRAACESSKSRNNAELSKQIEHPIASSKRRVAARKRRVAMRYDAWQRAGAQTLQI
jgi:hypothetical protein